LKQRLVVVIVTTPEFFAIIDEIEAAYGGDVDLTLLLQLDKSEDFLHQRPSACGKMRFQSIHCAMFLAQNVKILATSRARGS
jgi:hypothetical protein